MDNDATYYENKTPKRCVIEFQGFRNNNGQFIVKELVIYDTSTRVVNYFVFKPPYHIQKLNRKAHRTNKWLTSNFHHITWDEGFTEYKELTNIIRHYCKQYDEVYTSGNEKTKFIELFTTCKVKNINLDRGFLPYCYNGLCIGIKNPHHKFTNCALSRAFRVGELVIVGGEETYKFEVLDYAHHLAS